MNRKSIIIQKSRTHNECRDLLFNMSVDYLLRACSTATATATVAPTMGLLPIPRKPIISTCAGTDEEPANWASECMRPIVSVRAWVVDTG